MDDNTNIPSSKDLIAIAFEQLPTTEKMSAFEDILAVLSSDLGRFNDPVLERELDVMDGLCSNLSDRLEELAAIYGLKRPL